MGRPPAPLQRPKPVTFESPMPEIVGFILEQRMRQVGVDPVHIAKQTGLSRGHIYRIMRGEFETPYTTLEQIALTVGLTARQLLFEATVYGLDTTNARGQTIEKIRSILHQKTLLSLEESPH